MSRTLSQDDRAKPGQPVAQTEIDSPYTLTGVIALGGGDDRIHRAGRLARQFPHIRVVVTGMPNAGRVHALLGTGIDWKRVQIEHASRNTHEEAVNATELVKPRPGERWLLITSTSHMPRAICAFKKAGFPVEPWPIADVMETQKQRDQVVLRERLALGAYQMLGWCDKDP